MRSPGPWRFVIPDFELDFGILPNLELDLDGAYSIEGPASGSFSFDHGVPYSLWPSVKVGLYNDHDDQTNRARAVGIQVGPRIPIASGAHGIGFESLVVFGGSRRGLNVAVNLGAFVEPPADAVSRSPWASSRGSTCELTLDSQNRFQLTGELATAYFFTADPRQLHATSRHHLVREPEPGPFGRRHRRLPGGRRSLRHPVRLRAQAAHVRSRAARSW